VHGNYDEATASELCDVASDLLRRARQRERTRSLDEFQAVHDVNAMRRRASIYLTEAERRAGVEAVCKEKR